MAKLTKCENCGGKLEYIPSKNVYKCLHCGSTFELEDNKEKAVDLETSKADETSAKAESAEQKVNYEKESYSDLSYREVQKARIRGKMFKIDVPQLDHMLHKTEKKRVSYIVFAAIMFVLAAASFGLMVFCGMAMLPPLFGVNLESPAWDVFGLSTSFVGLGVVLGVVAALVVLAIFGLIGGYLIYNGIKSLQLSTATKEEMAYGPTISRFILSSIIVVVAVVVIMLALLFIVKDKEKLMGTALPWISIAVVVGFVAVFIKLIRDKVLAVRWFKTLPEAEQQNYREHANAIKLVRHKKERMDQRNRNIFWR